MAQSVPNDTFTQRTPVAAGSTATSSYSNVFAGIDPDEPLTSNARNGNSRCDGNGKATSDTGARMSNTTWWQFVGTGGGVTVSSTGSQPPFDTVLAVYDGTRNPFADGGALIACNDDVGPKGMAPSLTTSSVFLPTSQGHPYTVQVGTCESTTTSPQSCAASYGDIAVTVTPSGGPTVAPPGARPILPAAFSDLVARQNPSRRLTRITAYHVSRAPARTKVTVSCSPRRRCPFRRSIHGTIGSHPYSIARLLRRYRHGNIRWRATLTITLSKGGYRARRVKVTVNRRGIAHQGKPRIL
jgi:hypothetical protein